MRKPTGELEISKTDEITGNKDRIDGTSHHGDASNRRNRIYFIC